MPSTVYGCVYLSKQAIIDCWCDTIVNILLRELRLPTHPLKYSAILPHNIVKVKLLMLCLPAEIQSVGLL